MNGLIEWYRNGGGIMNFILVAAVIGLAVFLERFYVIVIKSKINGRAFIERVIQLVRGGKIDDAIKLCAQSKAALPDMGLLILRSRTRDESDLHTTGRYELTDRYRRDDGTVFLSGVQALARLPYEQLRVDRARQNFKCWPCGANGDVFSFVMKRDSLSFPEALKVLAAKAGVEIDERTTREDARKARLREVMESTIAFYHAVLTGSKTGQPALDYLRGRGFTDATIATHQLGYAPGGWDTLARSGRRTSSRSGSHSRASPPGAASTIDSASA